MTILDVDLAIASSYLATVLKPGDTLILVNRGTTQRRNQVVDVVKVAANNGPGPAACDHYFADSPDCLKCGWVPALDAWHLGRFFGPLVCRPYLYRWRGVLLLRGETAETMVANVSSALFGQPDQLKTVWREGSL